MISDQVLWQAFNSFWTEFWLELIKAEMDKKKDKDQNLLEHNFAMAKIEFSDLNHSSTDH